MANLLNLYAIIAYKTSFLEVLTSFFYVIMFSCVLYVIVCITSRHLRSADLLVFLKIEHTINNLINTGKYDNTKRLSKNNDNGFCRIIIGNGDLLGAPISVSQRKAAADKVKIA